MHESGAEFDTRCVGSRPCGSIENSQLPGVAFRYRQCVRGNAVSARFPKHKEDRNFTVL